MIYPILQAVLLGKDRNKDGKISAKELTSNCESSKFSDWVTFEEKRFNDELEIFKDGLLSPYEIINWLLPQSIQ